jgi:multidrug efflux pump subunit AcrA (membrane-fusion protein)
MPDMEIAVEDGSTVKASEALAAADEIVTQAEADAKGFDAAVSCFLRGGR